ncbi:putative glucan 1 3-beta-glucosidase A [Prunus yedoensis var. nudiflora]|uniref:Putative glucan 1 3-beta-glucosidase A n=1 Tax=Prunus yedoensis var. nudiflora TaxID=2094558 RepID=A0A314UGW9_PRUYE|nr:putative glucan 1 3-beta-glucosidase A [Prunus yedoensis var. nudiflora]
MAYYYFKIYHLLSLYLISCVVPLSLAQDFNLPFKAVNLGNWLITEGWMKPSLYDGIPNNDLLDGTQVQFKSTKLQKYIAPENGGGSGSVVVVNRDSASGWETFRLWRIDESSFNLRVFNKQFVGLPNQDQGTGLIAVSDSPGNTETFRIVRNDGDRNRVRIQASNGLFLQATSETQLTADYGGSGWEDDNPSVFIMTILSDKTLRGEYQLTNGYGPDKAPQVLQDHWNSYITEDDFRFLSSNGLNAVRIPVGWWIAKDPTPPKPFVGGSLQALDNAFTWAQNNGLKVIVDLHAVEGSQNGNDHSATRDGYQEWGDSNIQDTVAVIDFLASRYANHPALAAVELMNEPMAPGVNLDSLKNYYKAGYEAVRKHTSSAYVILSNRLGPADAKELLSFAGGLDRVAIDVHFYNLYSDTFNSFSVQQNVDFIYNQRASDLDAVTTSNGPLTFVGEWVAEWAINGASIEDYQRFAKAQIDVYGRATFGWAYWAYKCQNNHWDLKWMIENNYIKLN